MNHNESPQIEIVELEVRRRTGEGRKNNAEARCYFFHQGESIIDDLLERRNRPSKVYETCFPKVREEIKKVSGVDADKLRFWWSQYAGCRCPCSPGFLVKGLYGYDIFVTVKVAPPPQATFQEKYISDLVTMEIVVVDVRAD